MKKRVFLAWVAALVLLFTPGAAGPDSRTLLAGALGFSLAQWEIASFPEKWLNYVKGFVGVGPDAADLEEIEEFLARGQDLRRAEDELQRAMTMGQGAPEELRVSLDGARDRWAELRSPTEQAIEGAISSVVRDMGLTMSLKGILDFQFPPVDVKFGSLPRVLVLSPRDRIEYFATYLLRTDASLEEIETLEEAFFTHEGLSALAVLPGGLATYPAVISPNYSLEHTLTVAAHEWAHHYLFFYPLGRSYFGADGRMITVNETLADIIGRELGREAYFRITGIRLPEPPDEDAPRPQPSFDEPDAFDFNDEMRETRLRVDELLAEGKVEEAESYMEKRRQVFLDNGHLVRKLNQAFFAFHGSYGKSSASSSPVGRELENLRDRFDRLEEMIEAIRDVGSYDSYTALINEYEANVPS